MSRPWLTIFVLLCFLSQIIFTEPIKLTIQNKRLHKTVFGKYIVDKDNQNSSQQQSKVINGQLYQDNRKLMQNSNSSQLTDGATKANLLFDTVYFVNLTIGTPDQLFTVLVDTGSPSLWVKSIYCRTCDTKCVQLSNGVLYDPRKSSTGQISANTDAILYGDGSTVAGFIVKDTVKVAGATVAGQEILAASTSQDSFSGVMGLSRPEGEGSNDPQAVWSTVLQQNLVKNQVFSMWMDRSSAADATGELVFGGIDNSKFIPPLRNYSMSSALGSVYWSVQIGGVNLTDNKGSFECSTATSCGAIVDSGTSDILLPNDIATAIQNSFPSAQSSGGVGCSKLQEGFAKYIVDNEVEDVCQQIQELNNTEAIDIWLHKVCGFEVEGVPMCDQDELQEIEELIFDINNNSTQIKKSYRKLSQTIAPSSDSSGSSDCPSTTQDASDFSGFGGLGKRRKLAAHQKHYKFKSVDSCDLCKRVGVSLIEEMRSKCPSAKKYRNRRSLKQDLASQLAGSAGNNCQSVNSQQGASSYNVYRCSDANQGVNISINIGGDNYVLTPTDYSQPTTNTEYCIARVLPYGQSSGGSSGLQNVIILGVPFLKSYYAVYDQPNAQMRFAQNSQIQQSLITQGLSISGTQKQNYTSSSILVNILLIFVAYVFNLNK